MPVCMFSPEAVFLFLNTRSPTLSFTLLHAQDTVCSLCTVCSVATEVTRPAWEVGVKSRVEQGVAGTLGTAGLTPPTLPGLL